jgi:hypothetical protein
MDVGFLEKKLEALVRLLKIKVRHLNKKSHVVRLLAKQRYLVFEVFERTTKKINLRL